MMKLSIIRLSMAWAVGMILEPYYVVDAFISYRSHTVGRFVETNIVPWTCFRTTTTTTFCSKSKTSRSRFMADGFGRDTKKGKKKGKRQGGRLSNIGKISPPSSPKLDRFGLPLPTLDTIFPPLPPETELIPANQQQPPMLKDIEKYMSQHIPLNWALFDEKGVEKKSSSSNPWKLKLLHASPPVLAVENFFTKEECEEYMSLALKDDDSGLLEVNSATFSPLAQSKRTSTTWYCHFCQVPTLIAKAKRLMGMDSMDQMEEPQIVRYKTGQEFSWHYDEIPSAQLDNGGQRTATLLVYLNTLPSSKDGGGTVFRDLLTDGSNNNNSPNQQQQQLTMKPKQGSALLFFPSFANGSPDERTLHKGEVVTSTKDTKMIAQMWFHQRKYRPILPDGNSHNDAISIVQKKEEELRYNLIL